MTQERDIVDELREIQRMNTTLHGTQMAARAADEIERLRGMLEVQDEMVKHYVEERDEARKTACEWGSKNVRGAKLIAQIQGWDCFKETP